MDRQRRTLTALAITCALVMTLISATASASRETPNARSAPPAPTAYLEPVVVAYFSSGNIYSATDPYYPKDIPADKITHINYAFAKPESNGTCVLGDPWADYQRPFPAAQSVDGVADISGQALMGNFNQLRKLKLAHPGLKLFISIGGWTFSDWFSNAAVSASARQTFVQSCIDMFIRSDGVAAGVFSGIDIDWEYPVCCGEAGNINRPDDRHNATLLFKEFRAQLDALGAETGRQYLLTAAIPPGNLRSAGSFELARLSRILDWINLMGYDFHGQWEDTTNFDSPFRLDPADPTAPGLRPYWNVKGTVDFFRSEGVAATKLVLGIPFYGKQYIGVATSGHGLYQPFDDSALGDGDEAWQRDTQPGYHALVDIAGIVSGPTLSGPTPVGRRGFTRYWNSAAGEPFLWSSADERNGVATSVFISYEDPRSVNERVKYIERQGLRGAMIWEISLDTVDHDLIKVVTKLLP
ncbi:MAG: glycoside hydrolase family 18 protein [Candidatus Limnocylindrales bacterium]